MLQVLNTWKQILHYDGCSRVAAFGRWCMWRLRVALGRFPTAVDIGGARLQIDTPSGVQSLCYIFHSYDPNNTALLAEVLRQQGDRGVFLDVGANVGVYTLLASQVSSARVVAFEPSPDVLRRLQTNLRVNQRQNVTVMPIAVSDTEGSVQLVTDGDDAMAHVAEEAGQGAAVRCRRLDDVCAELGIKPTVAKIDIEGYEVTALRGFREYMEHLEMLFIEDGERPAVRNLVREAGFEGPFWSEARTRRLRCIPRPRQEDAIYLSKQGRAALARLGYVVESQERPSAQPLTAQPVRGGAA